MLEIIFQEAWKIKETDKVIEYLRFLQTRVPESYQKNEIIYTNWLLEIAVANNDYEQISLLLEAYYRQPDEFIDIFFRDIDLLMYSGQITELMKLMAAVAPKIAASYKIMPQGIDEFFELLYILKIIEFLELKTFDEGEVKRLMSKLENLNINFDKKELMIIISRLLGEIQSKWKAEEFNQTTPKEKCNKIFFTFS